MSYQYLEMGMAAVRSGSLEEAGRLLRLAIKSPDLNAPTRAIAYMWLAETTSDPTEKRSIYQQALDTDPGNADIRQRVDAFLKTQFQPPPPPPSIPEAPRPAAQAAPPPSGFPEQSTSGWTTTHTPAVNVPGGATANPYSAGMGAQPHTGPAMPGAAAPPQTPAQILAPQTGTVMDYIVTVIGGPNGNGTGFFASQQPMIVTTRHVVGGAETVTIEFSPGRGTTGTVIRTYSDYDLALIRIGFAPPAALPVSPMPRVPDDAQLTTVSYNGTMTRGTQRPTRRVMSAYWIPTDFASLPDSGGSPLFDQQNYLVGMMTKNTSRSADHYFGLHINLIRQCIDSALNDLAATKAVYCHDCGSLSRAGGVGYFFCEVCGATLPQAQSVTRYPIPQAEMFYAQPNAARCPHCQAVVGYHNGKCLRCGQPTS